MHGMEVDRSFAFVDLCGFTAYTESQGSVMATQTLAAFRAASRDIASRRGVRIAKWLGDGAMIVGVEPQPVLELLLETEHRSRTTGSSLALRFGVTFGKAILFEGDDYIGSVVNLAKRLCDAAEPHEILVGPDVEAYTPPWGELHDDGDLMIKGFDGTLVRRSLCLKEMRNPVVDPVCGLAIDPEYASGETVDGNGEKVVFCSPACEVTYLGSAGGPLF
jgi:class 3 adenylate cyclase/YHS domain-containing protein